MTTNGGQIGFFNSNVLKGGDFCGEELLTWALDPNSASILPCSTRTAKTLSEVEAFALRADDLKFVATQFRRLHSKQLQHTFRFYSQQWRTWAACFIQAAWHRYCRKKLDDTLYEKEKRLQAAIVVPPPSEEPSNEATKRDEESLSLKLGRGSPHRSAMPLEAGRWGKGKRRKDHD
ncbi:hypothetical protein PR202_ga07079 [Eleusine coracana subsp. coracana]|uniref:Uncharacterized protein n=1 Tax=Eleusine coracana subsp. coracana TaxID=191504 RepID=A0AAV5BYY8_ELECO|nr:hypothetical protein PR202_ga07079 [Eleusine coracana subsp. coracana]